MADGLSCDLILGADFIHHTRLVLDIHQGVIYFKFNPRNIIFLRNRKTSPESYRSNLLAKEPFDIEHLSQEKVDEIIRVCNRHRNILMGDLGRRDKITYDITLLDKRPVKAHPYQLAPPKMEAMRQITDQLLEEGVIQPSVSTYVCPAFLVCRPDKKPRLVIDLSLIHIFSIIKSRHF